MIDNNLNPLFYETLEVFIECNSIEEMPPIVLNVWDKDYGIVDTNDFIGRAVIRLNDAAHSNNDDIPEPRWHKVRMSFNEDEEPMGEILVSFSVVEDDYNYKIPYNYVNLIKQVQFKDYEIELNILGLRDLHSGGILPVKKAFIIFNLTSLIPPNCGLSLKNVKTQPNAPGPNPTINTLIKFKLPLPSEPLFCPRLSCSVHDHIYKGLKQPLIGTFTIPVGEILFTYQHEMRKDIRELKDIIHGLEALLEQAREDHESGQVETHLTTNRFAQGLNIQIEEFQEDDVKNKQKQVDNIFRKSVTKGVDNSSAKQPLLSNSINSDVPNEQM